MAEYQYAGPRFAGNVALVTGGLNGIGRAVVERLAAEGCQVVVADIMDQAAGEASLAEIGDKAVYLRLNVCVEAEWEAAAAMIATRFGRLDILVANAGVGGVSPVRDIKFESWRHTMSVNLDGVFLSTKHCMDLLAASGASRRGGSSIINMSSSMGLNGLANASAYSASKGGVRLFSKSTAVEFAQMKLPVRVNSIHPGFVRTPLLVANASAEDVAFYERETPVGRLAEVDEIAAAIAFLASEDASYMTGSELVVDGGYNAH
ncbi:SDR family NAD(P)-dependent oxidoreductase [Aquisediminimonas sediminicola]|uniref:SDR family NAD(P)-dependent oxidoreductase n=1 Tax=Alteraquisediminimonas sediminicola TaxID=2676787 RepID=UPI001C8E0DA5|nr:SDR family oxidoreductase [Aquisediminimonas sediminicola]